MRRSQRLIATAVLISLCGVLAGCGAGGGGLSNWDPSDMLDFLDTKKKLPGKREPVFPEGVPGIEQGVPKDLYKSNLEQQQDHTTAAASPSDESGPARRSGTTAGTAGSVPAGAEAGAADDAAAAAPAPKPKRLVHRRVTSLPKEEPAPQQQAAPQQQPMQQSQPTASPFPAPLPSDSFSH